jgi:Lrp/AsnC family transcriptional regulator, leucine-responsive regulatory protein
MDNKASVRATFLASEAVGTLVSCMMRPSPSETAIDDLDLALIDALRRDGRATLGELSATIGLSASAVKRRMDRLIGSGVIRGFTVVLDERRLGVELEAFALLSFAGTTAVDEIKRVAVDMPEVITVFTTAGDPDAIVHLRVRDVEHLTRAIDRLRRSERVTATKTLLVLDRSSP